MADRWLSVTVVMRHDGRADRRPGAVRDARTWGEAPSSICSSTRSAQIVRKVNTPATASGLLFGSMAPSVLPREGQLAPSGIIGLWVVVSGPVRQQQRHLTVDARHRRPVPSRRVGDRWVEQVVGKSCDCGGLIARPPDCARVSWRRRRGTSPGVADMVRRPRFDAPRTWAGRSSSTRPMRSSWMANRFTSRSWPWMTGPRTITGCPTTRFIRRSSSYGVSSNGR